MSKLLSFQGAHTIYWMPDPASQTNAAQQMLPFVK